MGGPARREQASLEHSVRMEAAHEKGVSTRAIGASYPAKKIGTVTLFRVRLAVAVKFVTVPIFRKHDTGMEAAHEKGVSTCSIGASYPAKKIGTKKSGQLRFFRALPAVAEKFVTVPIFPEGPLSRFA